MDSKEIAEIIHTHRNLIYKVAIMYAKSRDEADDIFQEICIQAYKGIKSFNGESKLSSWLYRVSINTAVSWVRKEKRFGSKSLRECDSFEDCSPFYIEEDNRESIEALRRAISHLSEVDKTLVMLYLDEVSNDDIAEILGLSAINVRVRMNRVKKKLKKIISDEQ